MWRAPQRRQPPAGSRRSYAPVDRRADMSKTVLRMMMNQASGAASAGDRPPRVHFYRAPSAEVFSEDALGRDFAADGPGRDGHRRHRVQIAPSARPTSRQPRRQQGDASRGFISGQASPSGEVLTSLLWQRNRAPTPLLALRRHLAVPARVYVAKLRRTASCRACAGQLHRQRLAAEQVFGHPEGRVL